MVSSYTFWLLFSFSYVGVLVKSNFKDHWSVKSFTVESYAFGKKTDTFKLYKVEERHLWNLAQH